MHGAVDDGDCPGCAGRKFDLSAESVAALVDQIPISPELRADEATVAQRLAACMACDALREGVLCTYCGCFIRFRVRPGKAYCPHPIGGKWPEKIVRGALHES